MARQAPGSHTLTLQTGLLAPHQPSEVAPQQASCTLVKPEVTSTSRNSPVPEANFSPKGRRKGVIGVRCMELCITVRSLLPSRPKTGESGSRREPSLRTLHARPDLLYALPLKRPSSATTGHRRNPPARAPPRAVAPARTAVHRPKRRRLSLLTPPGWQVQDPGPSLRPCNCHQRRRRQWERVSVGKRGAASWV